MSNTLSQIGTKVGTEFKAHRLRIEALEDALDLKITSTEKGVANGVATLDASGKVPSSQLPSYVDDVVEATNLASFPATGETGKIYVALDTNKAYRWSGSAYIYITSGAVDSVAGKTGVVTLVKGDVGLGNVDDTADVNKPISTATQSALNAKQATLVSGTNIKTINGSSVLGSGDIRVSTYSLEWSQTTFYITQQATATITNFDSYTNYNVTALLGTVSIAGDTITYTAPAGAGNEVVSINGVAVASFAVLGAGIIAPTINTPLSASTDNSEVVTFDLSDFVVIPTGFDTHISTTVEVYTDPGMTNLSATVTKTTGDLTLVAVGSHVVSTTYYARAKYSGSVLTSDWSATRSYTTKNTFTQAYGVDWNPTTDTYSRTGFAVGTANSTSYAGAIQTQMKRCVLNANGTVAYYLHPTNSTLKADGAAATIDGSAGNVMVEIPKFYHKYENVGGVHKYSVSPIPEAGYTVHPAFIRGGVEKNFRYYPAYEGWYNGNKLISGSGKVPTVNQTRATFRSYAAANGTGWSLIDWNLLYAVQLLFLTEYATFDTQAMLGNGNDTGGDYTMTTGSSNGIGNGSSPATNDDTWMSYRGIENWYASMWKFIDGVNVQERVYFVNNKPATFADDVFTGDYVSTGITSAASSGYVSNMSSSNKGFIPSEVTGSSSTKVPDYFYQNTGNRIVLFGGFAGIGLSAGGFCLGADGAASAASAAVGSGVSY